jgi:hypothetical protein
MWAGTSSHISPLGFGPDLGPEFAPTPDLEFDLDLDFNFEFGLDLDLDFDSDSDFDFDFDFDFEFDLDWILMSPSGEPSRGWEEASIRVALNLWDRSGAESDRRPPSAPLPRVCRLCILLMSWWAWLQLSLSS